VIFQSDSVLSRIENHTFSACSGLVAICIPASVEILCAHCFNQCLNLSEVTFAFGSKVSQIEGSAFGGCSKLSSIRIHSPIEHFPAGCFNGCPQLSITIVDADSGDAIARGPGDDGTQNEGSPADCDCHVEHTGQDK
jgi:hypothetical protein